MGSGQSAGDMGGGLVSRALAVVALHGRRGRRVGRRGRVELAVLGPGDPAQRAHLLVHADRVVELLLGLAGGDSRVAGVELLLGQLRLELLLVGAGGRLDLGLLGGHVLARLLGGGGRVGGLLLGGLLGLAVVLAVLVDRLPAHLVHEVLAEVPDAVGGLLGGRVLAAALGARAALRLDLLGGGLLHGRRFVAPLA